MNLTNDQTAPLEQSELEKSIKDKRILIIGIGLDIDGRRLQKKIDSDFFDYVARINKHYGVEKDTGTRTDFIFTRWYQWVKKGMNFFSDSEIENAKEVIILNQHVGYSETEKQILLAELDHDNASAGLQAIHYFLNRGVKELWLLGFGKFSDGFKEKRYCDNSFNFKKGEKDNNPVYDWNKERKWLLNQSKIIFL